MTLSAMPDVQSAFDPRNIAIDQVGIKAIKHPLTLTDGTHQQHTIAECELTVGLPADKKGTHMSRFVALLNAEPLQLSLANLPDWTRRMAKLLDAHQAQARFTMPFFLEKTAPVSGQKALMDYELTLSGHLQADDSAETHLQLVVPVTSLCPCSKEISAYGAHNQRSHITVTARVANPDLSLADLIRRIEDQGSCALWGLLKRTDEKFITEHAFDNPKFVEDMIRDVAGTLADYPGLSGFRVTVENFESIHNHSAWAVIDRMG
ncbi:GTP cyclohydrolase [Halothiobacillus diazotrophicus]|uniref:GTP cyclohydrolase FolE2 n=1 Tax=Halothiobacillus diazotrophicus TaxID=1860122 RepID=A0A191ZGH1_9GAMM|nr:GTP cyclohydrolase FolE2 [Halothiobacillus diazotrophicus]ANJ66952.1 GTP cyclohydrolase [Halothiobacillus diazotrophicus]